MSLTRFFRRKHWDAQRAAELDSYLQIETDRNIQAGMTNEDARAAARRKLGNVTMIREEIYEMNSISILDALWRDLRFTYRTLCKRPGFTATVILSLALGIGANTAIFSLVDAILFRPAPVPDAGGLIAIDTAASRLTQFGNSCYLDYVDFCKRGKSFQGLTAYQEMSAGMNPAGAAPDAKPQIVYGLLVSGNFFSTLEVQPVVGRAFLPDEDRVPGKNPVAVISYALWKRVFESDPSISGKEIKLSGHSFTIVGVAPQPFTGPDIYYRPDVYVPTMMSAALIPDGGSVLTERSWRGFNLRGRLKPGVTVAQAQAEMNVIMRDLEREHPESNKDTVAFVRTEMARRRADKDALLVPGLLMGLVILVLLMACANVASLMMAKASSRLREISTQLAIGAPRGSLVRQFLTESAVLAALGCAGGVLLGDLCIRGFTATMPFSGPNGPEFRLDNRVLVYAALASLAAIFLFGLVPAFTAVRDAWSAINTRASVSASRSFSAVARRVLIGGQVALSAVLLITGGLFLKAFTRAQSLDLGFNPDHLLLVTIDPSLRGYSNDQAARFYQQLLPQLASLRGVSSVSLAANVPFLFGGSWDVSVDGYTAPDGEKFLDLATNQVGAGYFATMQIPLLQGREFNDRDTAKAPEVAIVNETFARRYIVQNGGLEKAIGHIIRLRGDKPIRIVGIVKDSTSGQIGAPAMPWFYLADLQEAAPRRTIQIRTVGDPSAIAPEIRRRVTDVDPEVAPISVLTMSSVVSGQGLFLPRMIAMLSTAFGIVALSLAVIGLYGVVSFMVGRRTQEIGIRMALGAETSAVLKMVLADGVRLAATGLAIGIGAALVATPLIENLLVGVSPRDPEIFICVAWVLFAATLTASWIPAYRAARVDPNIALRYE